MEEKKLQDAGSVETAEKRDSVVKADEAVKEEAKREAVKPSETKTASAGDDSNKGTSVSQSKGDTNNSKSDLGLKPYKQKEKSKFGMFLKKNKVWLILLLVAVVIGLLVWGVITWKNNFQASLKNMSPKDELTTVEKRNLDQTITTTGTIKSTEIRTLTSPVKDAKITAVNYEVGDYVNEGDVVVAFSVTNINQKIEDLQKDISTSRQKDAINSQNRDREYVYSYGNEAVNMTQATEKVNLALENLYEACDAYGSAKRAKSEFEDKCNRGEYPEEYANMQDDGAALRKYIDSTWASLDQAVTTAYQRQQEAERSYQQAVEAQANTVRSSTNSLATADANYQLGNISAKDSTTSLERQLKQYQDSLDDYLVYAPISGIVTEVNVEEGNGYISGNLMTIQRDDSFMVTTEIDEYDIPSVAEGQKVIIKTDATRDDELEGVVSFVSPTATAATAGASGVTYKVEIDVKTADPRIKIGMSAKLNIITESHAGVLAVRYDAVVEDEDGNPVVFYRDPELTKKIEAEKEKKKNDSKIKNSIPVFGTDGKPTNAPESDEDKKDNKKEKIPSKNGEDDSDAKYIRPQGDDVVEIPVTVGVEDDFYTEISGTDIKEGMELIVPEKKNTKNPFEDMMFSMGM